MSVEKIAAVICLTALAPLTGCGSSASDRAHALRAECGRDARAWVAAFVTEFRRGQPDWSSRFRSHYDTRTSRCYVELWLDTTPESGARLSSVFHESNLVDVDENRVIGEVYERTDLQTNVTTVLRCSVGDRKCGTIAEWETLMKPYMDQ
jgi:hypothetical protein